MKTINLANYKNPLIDIGNFVSEHLNKNQNNQIEDAITECVLCGKGIKSSSNHYTIVCGGGTPDFLIHKDEWNYAESKENKDGGFMGSWQIGSECFKKIKNLPNIKNYIKKNQLNKEGK